jgi:hypothetical protein
MNIETAANPADAGVVTLPEAETDAAQTEAQTPAEGGSDPIADLAREALGETPAEASPVEIEYEGKKFTVDPVLRDAFMRDADYRKKTMSLAEERKAFQSEREQLTATANQAKELREAETALAILDRDIASLSQMPTDGMTQADYDKAVARLQRLQTDRQALAGAITTEQQKAQTEWSQGLEKARADCFREASARINGFTETRRDELEQFAISMGADKGEVALTTEPWAYELLHFADIGKKFIERQRNAANMRNAATGNPATTVGGASSGGKSPDDMSPAEMAKHLGY